MFTFIKKKITLISSLILVCIVYFAMKYPEINEEEKLELINNFKFSRLDLNKIDNDKKIRSVHPSLERISSWISAVGASVSLNDLDGDGLPNDICHIDPRLDEINVSPVPGTGDRYEKFSLKPSSDIEMDNTMAPTGCLMGDFNEDGKTDILVYYWGRTPILFFQIKNKIIRKEKLTSESFHSVEICPNERWYTDCVTTADFDGDGHLDIIVCNYFKDGAEILNPEDDKVQSMHDSKSHAYNGGGTYFFLWKENKKINNKLAISEYKKISGLLDPKVEYGWTLAVGAADISGDLLPEIYLGQDFGPDRLLYNKSTPGNLEFIELKGRTNKLQPKSFTLGNDSFKGMGCDFGDLNKDGILDIFVSNITSEWALQESNFLWLSNGNLKDIDEGIAPYYQASEQLGLSRSGWAWDAKIADFNNDGILEIAVATGFIKGESLGWARLQALASGNDKMISNPGNWPPFKPGIDLSGHELNAFFVKSKNGRFYNLSKYVGLEQKTVTRGLAVADVDGDGDLDFAAANQWENSNFFINECSNPGSYLILNCMVEGNSDKIEIIKGITNQRTDIYPGVGAQVKVLLPNGEKMFSQVDGGNGHSGKRSNQIHFGLGNLKEDKINIEVYWRGKEGSTHKKQIAVEKGYNTLILGGE
jgi:hypothetical protein